MTHLATLQTIDPSITVPTLDIEIVEEADHPKSIGDFHVGVEEMEFFRLLMNALERGQQVMAINGPEGSGKTSLIRQFAAGMDLPFLEMQTSESQPERLMTINGSYCPVDGLSDEQFNTLLVAISGPAVVVIKGGSLHGLRDALAYASLVEAHTVLHPQAIVCFEHTREDGDHLKLANRNGILLLNIAGRDDEGKRLPSHHVKIEAVCAPTEALKSNCRMKLEHAISKVSNELWDKWESSPANVAAKGVMPALIEVTSRIASITQNLDAGTDDDYAAAFAVTTVMNFIQEVMVGNYYAQHSVRTLLATLPGTIGREVTLDWQTYSMLKSLKEKERTLLS